MTADGIFKIVGGITLLAMITVILTNYTGAGSIIRALGDVYSHALSTAMGH